jgi:hypothetical protein
MAGAMECVSDSVARVCAMDGTWVPEPCQQGSTCMNGQCVATQNVACTAAMNTCMDSTHALLCNSNGVGFMQVTCPANTVCLGNGLCKGDCVVGSSTCITVNATPNAAVQTCTDGFNQTQTLCMPDQTACVITSATTTSLPGVTVSTAACQPLGCTPNAAACGNKAMDPNNTDPSFVSNCLASPQGYKWQTTQCAVANSCSPGGGGAACAVNCIPGATRCVPGFGSPQGMQTCGSNGTWGATVACLADPTGAEQACQTLGGGPAICGDPLCASNTGACEADGFHPCVNGKVSTTAVACTTGICVPSGGGPVGGLTPGSCKAQCSTGESKCAGTLAFQTCVNGRWSGTATSCTTAGDTCQQWPDPANPTGTLTICGTCVPGTHRCTNNAGNPGGNTDIETCDSTGHWQAHAACAVGQCQIVSLISVSPPVFDAACVAQCIPNSTYCADASNWATCTANGTPGTATACTANTYCRRNPSGQAVGTGAGACVQCVGPNIAGGNEVGLVDSRCTDGSGNPTGALSPDLEVCASDNTWTTAAANETICNNVVAGSHCTPEVFGSSCGPCPVPGGGSVPVCTNTNLAGLGTPTSCAAAFGTWPVATSGGGSPTTDCCINAISGLSSNPTPALCQ